MPLTRRELLAGGATALFAAGCHRRKPLPEDSEVFDVAIVGSGFAGIHLALETVAAGLETVVVEAGAPSGLFSDGGLAGEFRHEDTGSVPYPVPSIRAIAVGGTSTHWGGVVTRLWPSDFRLRTAFGRGADWPFPYEDLAALYCRAESLLAVHGAAPSVIAEPGRDCAFPFVAEAPYVSPAVAIEGQEPAFFRVPRSRRDGHSGPVRLVSSEIPRLVASDRGTLLAGRAVTRVVSKDGKRIDHLETRGADGSLHRVRAKLFVLAAGAIEIPRLLLDSRSTHFPNGVGNTHDHVGRYFGVHPSLEFDFRTSQPHGLPPGEHRSCVLNDHHRAAGRNALHYQLDVHDESRLRWKLQPEIEARAENRVALAPKATDRLGRAVPLLRLDYSARDQRTLAYATEFLRERRAELAHPGERAQRYSRWRAHPSGTCRMAARPEDGVVDSDGRVFGVDNLYVSGSATFPSAGTANPTNTVVALTLRLAEHVIARLGRRA